MSFGQAARHAPVLRIDHEPADRVGQGGVKHSCCLKCLLHYPHGRAVAHVPAAGLQQRAGVGSPAAARLARIAGGAVADRQPPQPAGLCSRRVTVGAPRPWRSARPRRSGPGGHGRPAPRSSARPPHPAAFDEPHDLAAGAAAHLGDDALRQWMGRLSAPVSSGKDHAWPASSARRRSTWASRERCADGPQPLGHVGIGVAHPVVHAAVRQGLHGREHFGLAREPVRFQPRRSPPRAPAIARPWAGRTNSTPWRSRSASSRSSEAR